MEVERSGDGRAFLATAGPLLARHEARNNLILGVAATAADHPDAYAELRTWTVLDGGEPVAAALRTPPHNLALGDPVSATALSALLAAVLEDEPALPGVLGNEPYAQEAATTLAAANGRRVEVTTRMGVFELTEVVSPSRASGAARPASAGDRELLLAWLEAFTIEAIAEPAVHLERLELSLDSRWSPPEGGLWFWDDGGEPVSLAGFGAPTPTGIRIGPVYTPPEHRRRGYARALVADLSAEMLRRGCRACFLYTDLSNPTSNRIYAEIGYRRVGDAIEYRFA